MKARRDRGVIIDCGLFVPELMRYRGGSNEAAKQERAQEARLLVFIPADEADELLRLLANHDR